MCAQDIAGEEDTGGGQTQDGASGDSATPDPGTADADTGGPGVGDTSSDTSLDTSLEPPVPRTTCVVDSWTECIDPTGELRQDQIESGAGNESPSPSNRLYSFLNSSCSLNSVPGRLLWEVTDTDMLCAAEPADFYRTSIYRCMEHDMILTVKFTLEPVCHDEEVRMDVYRFIEGAHVEQECEASAPCRREGASLIRRFIIPRGTGLIDYYSGIVSEQENTMFKYRFDAELRIR